MIRLRMSSSDFERMRFAYSPLAEVTESLWMVNSGRIHPLHESWFALTRDRLHEADLTLLRAVVPARPNLADILFAGVCDATTTIEKQLQVVADCPVDRLRRDLEQVWHGETPPAAAQRLVSDGAGGPRRLADALWQYWTIAVEPHWPQIRGVLDADVAYRTARLAKGGIQALLSDLHPELALQEHAIHVHGGRHESEHQLHGAGLLLVPCVFAWPNVIVDPGPGSPPSITYGPRGIGELWPTVARDAQQDDALGALLGRSRAAILVCVGLPRSTSELARDLGQTAPAVSAHLSVLRRNGLVTSWRSGRRVLYQRTPLATSIVVASGSTVDGVAPGSA